jgi:hypothetical protein
VIKSKIFPTLPVTMIRALKLAAVRHDCAAADIIRELVEEFLNKHAQSQSQVASDQCRP